MNKITTSRDLTDYEGAVFVDTTLGNVVLTLPSAVDYERVLIIKMTDGANKVTCNVVQGESIDGSPDLKLNSQYDSVTLISNGEGWSII